MVQGKINNNIFIGYVYRLIFSIALQKSASTPLASKAPVWVLHQPIAYHIPSFKKVQSSIHSLSLPFQPQLAVLFILPCVLFTPEKPFTQFAHNLVILNVSGISIKYTKHKCKGTGWHYVSLYRSL